MEGHEVAGWPRPRRASWPWAASCNPDRGRACRSPSRQGARPGRRGLGGKNPLHLINSAEVGAADEESRCAVAGSLSAWGIYRRLSGGAHRPAGEGRAEPLAHGDHATDGAWQADYDAWQRRDLSARRYVYVWADGVYLQA